MSFEVIVLSSSTQPDGSFSCSGVFWLTANSNNIVPLPSFTSQVPFIDNTDLNSLQTGQLVEQSFITGFYASGTSLATVQADLQTRFTTAQAAFGTQNPPLANLVGTTFDGAVWTSSSPFSPFGVNVTTGTLGALNATAQIAITGSVQSVGMQVEAGTLIGSIIAESSTDGGTVWNQVLFNFVTSGQALTNLKSFGFGWASSNTALGATIIVNGGAGLVRVRVYAYTSGSCSITLRASNANDPSIALFTSQSGAVSPQQIAVVGGVSSGTAFATGVTRTKRVDRAGNSRTGFDTLLAHDSIEGTNVNTWLWTQSTATMTIAQTAGVLTLNNNGTLTTTTDAIITSNRQFPIYHHGMLKFAMRVKAVPGPTNAFIEFGIGAPAGTTAVINNGAFFRLNGTALSTVTSFNGTENSVSRSTVISSAQFYFFFILIQDNYAHFIIEDTSGTPILDTFVAFPTTVTGLSTTSHLPAFGRVYNSAAVGTAAKLNIGSYDTFLVDLNTTKPWSEQMAGTGSGANINPTTFAQALQLAAAAGPASTTPVNSGSAYATLGGEFLLTATATSVNLLGIFGYQVPSPYTLFITEIFMPQPVITTALTTTASIYEFALQVASSNVPSSATGPRYPIGVFSAAASAAAGTVMNGNPLQIRLTSPIVVPPGQFVLIMMKAILGAATGAYQGSILVNGYYE